VDLPADGRVLDATGDQVLLLHRDDLDVETVTLHALVRHP